MLLFSGNTARCLITVKCMSVKDIRNNVILWLRLLSSSDEQRKFEREAAGEAAGGELVEVWFGSFYPDDKLNPELYSPGELASLIEFHSVFSKYADRLPTNLSDLHRMSEWKEIQAAAIAALQKCGW